MLTTWLTERRESVSSCLMWEVWAAISYLFPQKVCIFRGPSQQESWPVCPRMDYCCNKQRHSPAAHVNVPTSSVHSNLHLPRPAIIQSHICKWVGSPMRPAFAGQVTHYNSTGFCTACTIHSDQSCSPAEELIRKTAAHNSSWFRTFTEF